MNKEVSTWVKAIECKKSGSSNGRETIGGNFKTKYLENKEGEGIKSYMKKFKLLTFK